MSTVFICRDFALDGVLDQVAAAVERCGVDVIRGPESRPGQRLVYAPDLYETLFAPVDVMMFSSRSIGSRAVMTAAPRLRAIINPTIGLDTVDLRAADELAIVVGNGAVPENYLGMAEATLMLMLNLRFQLRVTEDILRGTRPRPALRVESLHAQMLRGTTIGMIGLGRIARATIDLLRPFGVEILASVRRPLSVGSGASVPSGVTLVDFDTVMAKSDIVAVFATGEEANRNLIDARSLALMKPSAYLVNTARGLLVDEAALYEALRTRRIAGAALDTFAVEPLPDDSPLRTLDNVILTPHFLGFTKDVLAATIPVAVANIERVLAGELPLYCANPDVEPRWRERLARLG